MGIIYHITAGGERHAREADEPPSLQEMQALVGGYVEMVTVTFDGEACQMFVDEDGMSKAKKPNREILRMCAAGLLDLHGAGPVLGDAVILKGLAWD